MNPIDSSDTDAVGWHLIARGGDMTARVHAHMQLGVLPSGDFSFDAPDAVVELDTRDEHLCISVLSPKFELEIGDGQRTRELTINPQTHIRLEFLGHLLDIDNDFAVSSSAGDALEICVVREGEPRVLPGSAKLPQKSSAQIIVAEQFAGGRSPDLRALPGERLGVDARPIERRSGVRRVAGALAGSTLIIFTLVVVALYVAERATAPSGTPGTEAVIESVPPGPEVPPGPATDPGPAPVPEPVEAEVAAGVGPDVLARFAALVEMEPLPDKSMLDFAVESLKSLRAAYPEDPGVPAALTRLAERLVVEARSAYDRGDAFLAGRLIEQAATIGLASVSVDETLRYFDSNPPGAETVAGPSEVESPIASPDTVQQSQPDVVEAEQEVAEEGSQEAPPVLSAVASGSDELDQLVESATGIALGALAVDMVITDTAPAGPDPSAALGLVAASQLPTGFAQEEAVPAALGAGNREPDDALVDGGSDPALSDPIFRPFSELTVTEQEPLTYPSRALDGAEGSVLVEFTVTETGEVNGLKITGDAPTVFIQEAARAIRQWRFQPILVNGTAVAVQTGLRVTFRG